MTTVGNKLNIGNAQLVNKQYSYERFKTKDNFNVVLSRNQVPKKEGGLFKLLVYRDDRKPLIIRGIKTKKQGYSLIKTIA